MTVLLFLVPYMLHLYSISPVNYIIYTTAARDVPIPELAVSAERDKKYIVIIIIKQL